MLLVFRAALKFSFLSSERRLFRGAPLERRRAAPYGPQAQQFGPAVDPLLRSRATPIRGATAQCAPPPRERFGLFSAPLEWLLSRDLWALYATPEWFRWRYKAADLFSNAPRERRSLQRAIEAYETAVLSARKATLWRARAALTLTILSLAFAAGIGNNHLTERLTEVGASQQETALVVVSVAMVTILVGRTLEAQADAFSVRAALTTAALIGATAAALVDTGTEGTYADRITVFQRIPVTAVGTAVFFGCVYGLFVFFYRFSPVQWLSRRVRSPDLLGCWVAIRLADAVLASRCSVHADDPGFVRVHAFDALDHAASAIQKYLPRALATRNLRVDDAVRSECWRMGTALRSRRRDLLPIPLVQGGRHLDGWVELIDLAMEGRWWNLERSEAAPSIADRFGPQIFTSVLIALVLLGMGASWWWAARGRGAAVQWVEQYLTTASLLFIGRAVWTGVRFVRARPTF
ncbi:MAG: hypothetical protein M3409_09820 [Gemmatimonadota bacterium]|nr:hypothetical protein [Gemmatimonadota bacterium]